MEILRKLYDIEDETERLEAAKNEVVKMIDDVEKRVSGGIARIETVDKYNEIVRMFISFMDLETVLSADYMKRYENLEKRVRLMSELL